MLSKNLRLKVSLLLLLLGVLASGSAFAGSAVIGSVAGSMNATIGGQPLLPNTTIFSGDSLQVNDGAAVVTVENASRMVFGRETVASFLRDANEVTVLLGQGNVSLYHPGEKVAVRVKVGDFSIVPAKGFKTLGDVAMIGDTLVITAKEGLLRVEGKGSAVEVAKGNTITLPMQPPKAPTGAAAGARMSAGTALQVASAATGATAAVFAGVAISRANDAKDAANAANATAGQAVTAANAATAAANAATTAANAANATALAVGCALDKAFPNQSPSPFIPPTGTKCP